MVNFAQANDLQCHSRADPAQTPGRLRQGGSNHLSSLGVPAGPPCGRISALSDSGGSNPIASMEDTMRRSAFAVVVGGAFAIFSAHAQTAAPDAENGRFTFNPVADGLLRLDTRSGQV